MTATIGSSGPRSCTKQQPIPTEGVRRMNQVTAAADDHPSIRSDHQFRRHPLSALCGDMSDDELDELVLDVKQHGLRDRVIYLAPHDGEMKIVDGWHRYFAAWIAERDDELDMRAYTGTDLVGDVIRANVLRRQLTAAQRARIFIEAYDQTGSGSNQYVTRSVVTTNNQQKSTKDTESPCNVARSSATAEEIANQAKVSVRTVKSERARIRAERDGGDSKPKKKPRRKGATPTERMKAEIRRLLEEVDTRDAKIRALEAQATDDPDATIAVLAAKLTAAEADARTWRSRHADERRRADNFKRLAAKLQRGGK